MSEGRVAPNDMDAEAAVLSACMLDKQAMPRVSAILRPEDFYSEAHRQIFAACMTLSMAGKPVDIVQVLGELKTSDRLAQVGGSPYITEVLNAAPAVSNVTEYAKTVRRKSRRRATITAAQRVVAEGYSAGDPDDEYLVRSETLIREASRLSDDDELRTNAETLKELVKNIERASQAGAMVTGIPTGLDRYDRLTLGLHAKHLTVIGARPGKGKTALGATIAANVACSGIGVIFISLEMSREEILTRLLSAFSGIDGTLLKLGMLSQAQWSRLTEAAVKLSQIPLWIEDRVGMTVHDIRSRVFGMIDRSKKRLTDPELPEIYRKTAIGLVAVDYLQKIKVPLSDRKKGRYEQVGDIAAGLKQLARETTMPLVALAQLRRAEKGKESSEPTMDNLRESGDIEQEADNIALIHAPEEDTRELLVVKARGGRVGRASVIWRPELTWFDNPSDTEAA